MTNNCIECPRVTYSDTFTCHACPANKFQDSAGQSSCKSCDAGKYSLAKATACTNCERGKYRTSKMTGACESCETGKYSCFGAKSAASCLSVPVRVIGGECVSCEVMLRSCGDGQYLAGCGYDFNFNGTDIFQFLMVFIGSLAA